MEHIISFAQNVSPLGIIAILVIIVFQLLKGNNWITKIKDTQQEKYPKLEGFMKTLDEIQGQNKLLLENHFQHEIPEMMRDMSSIKEATSRIEKQNEKVIELLTDIKFKIK